MNSETAYQELLKKIKSGRLTQQELELEKVRVAGKYCLNRIIKNSELISYAEKNGYPGLKEFLRTKPTRTLSGVANVAVMWMGSNGFSCPFKCVYCPPVGHTKNGKKIFAPKSYLGVEPTTLRALRNGYDPRLQVDNRLQQLHAIGHGTDKCELIIMGGTFLSWGKNNCTGFVKSCFDALNGKTSKNIDEAHKINESAKNRCVGLTIETRADCCSEEQIAYMLSLGTTRVELGVQTTDDNLLKLVKRGHDADANINAFARLKDAGLKVTAHWMPGLTGLYGSVDMWKEVESFREMFSNPSYRPDELKIYPTLVIPGTELYKLWKQGKYEAMGFEQTVDLLIELKKIVPEYVRIKRVSRDISEHESAAGARTTNIRQLVAEKMKLDKIKCSCIRCREISNRKGISGDAALHKMEYEASGGREVFLSFDGKDSLIAFLRLRIDDSDAAKIRELHVYGEMAPIGFSLPKKTLEKKADDMAIDPQGEGIYQHHGFGKKLMAEAERIAKKEGKSSVQVTSGVGVRDYYRKIGYTLKKPYMIKKI